jgi:hypothetical protein
LIYFGGIINTDQMALRCSKNTQLCSRRFPITHPDSHGSWKPAFGIDDGFGALKLTKTKPMIKIERTPTLNGTGK